MDGIFEYKSVINYEKICYENQEFAKK